MPSKSLLSNNEYDSGTVVIRGKGKHLDGQKRRAGETETRVKHNSERSIKQNKLDDATDASKPLRINPAIKQRIIQARGAQKIKQKEFAQKIQVQPQIIQNYENGKATADVNILRKMERILKVKLTGKEFSGINV